MQKKLNELDASALAPLLARREISAEQLVQACLDRIIEREPAVQAWSHLNPEAPLAQARQLDRGAVQGLLHGLPVGVKDLFDTADMPSTYGSPIYAKHQPAADASAVALCREQGAIMLGKTVSTEFATFNPGKTRNPHRLTHTPGGSSSGSAAAVADHMVPLAFGSQTAASVIRPAAYCGVVGYKPSFGIIHRAGVKSLSDVLDTVGFFGRSVADVALFTAAITGEQGLLQLDIPHSPRVALCQTHEWSYADADTQAAMVEAARVLAQSGMPVRELSLPDLFARLLPAQIDIMAFDLARSLAHERITQSDWLSSRAWPSRLSSIGLICSWLGRRARWFQWRWVSTKCCLRRVPPVKHRPRWNKPVTQSLAESGRCLVCLACICHFLKGVPGCRSGCR